MKVNGAGPWNTFKIVVLAVPPDSIDVLHAKCYTYNAPYTRPDPPYEKSYNDQMEVSLNMD